MRAARGELSGRRKHFRILSKAPTATLYAVGGTPGGWQAGGRAPLPQQVPVRLNGSSFLRQQYSLWEEPQASTWSGCSSNQIPGEAVVGEQLCGWECGECGKWEEGEGQLTGDALTVPQERCPSF
jgi:hypothetical protein